MRNDSVNDYDLIDTTGRTLKNCSNKVGSNLANFMDSINFWDQEKCFGAGSD